ncbi:MAG: SusD/RagB family nutrient-binding outer membrane lipoprotein, partial [Bacteroidales bacterium]
LKLKLFLRQCEVRPEVAQAGIENLYAGEPEFLSADAKMDYFSDASGARNPLYETEEIILGGNPNLVLSRTLHSFLEDNSDYDRLDYMFYTPADGGSHKSLIQGNYNDPEEPAGTNHTSYSKPAFFAAAPVYLMSSSEANFIQAEAILRYNVASYADALEKYNQGISDAFVRVLSEYPFASEEEIVEKAEAFYNGPYRLPAEGSPLESQIETIILQKWVALAGIQSLETFFEHNRTHYPKISDVPADDGDYEPGYFTVSVNNVTSGRFPKRLIFPESETSGNPNTPEAMPVWERVWWDTKAE